MSNITNRLTGCYMKQAEPNGDILLSVHVDAFSEELQKAKELTGTEAGWVDLRITKNARPEGRGYTHKLKLVI